MTERRSAQSAEWLQPPIEQEGLQRYVETLRERTGLIVLIALLSAAVAIAYVLTAQKTYRAEADLLITPISSTNATLTSLGLIAESSDPTRNVETASRLATTIEVAVRARQILHSARSPRSLLANVRAEPVAQSNIVAIIAEAGTPQAARDLANAFGEAAVANRTETLHNLIDAALPGLKVRSCGNRAPAPAPARRASSWRSYSCCGAARTPPSGWRRTPTCRPTRPRRDPC